jgi:hypothetical protein
MRFQIANYQPAEYTFDEACFQAGDYDGENTSSECKLMMEFIMEKIELIS